MKLNKLLAVIAILINLSAVNAAQAQTAPTDQHCDILYAGQTTAVGSVCVTVNTSDVNLDYLLIGDWKLTEAHAWIGDNLAGLPVNGGGNPQIGLFPYQADALSAATYSFTIPISQLAVNVDTFCNAEIFVAAHAVVTRTVAGGAGGNASDDDDDDDDEKSDKSGKSGKSGKAGKSSSAGKSSNPSAGSGKGTAQNAVASTSSSKGKANVAGKDGKSEQSGKSGKSGQSGKSGDQSGGGSTQPATQTESAWAGSMQIASGGSWARYFSFTNDFCDNTDPKYPVVVLPQSCFNVFGRGVTSTAPVTVSNFTPVGVTDTNIAWLNTYSSSTGYFGGDLVRADGTIVGGFLAGLEGNPGFAAELWLNNANPSLKIRSANIYFDTAGFYQDMSPLDYGSSLVGNGTGALVGAWALSMVPEQIDTIVHAVICPTTVAD